MTAMLLPGEPLGKPRVMTQPMAAVVCDLCARPVRELWELASRGRGLDIVRLSAMLVCRACAEATRPPPTLSRTLLDGPAIAAALHVHRSTVRRWRLPARGWAGGRVLYDLNEAIEAQQHAWQRMRHRE